jgi:2-dehydro-3-deoxy-D-arabinonate dehydratase
VLLFRTAAGWWLQTAPGTGVLLTQDAADSITTREDLYDYLLTISRGLPVVPLPGTPLAPIEQQEVWAAGVTYLRSRSARMAESESNGGGDFYARVYDAERPELFFKSTPHRVVGTETAVRIRRDSHWNVPEPELALLISPGGTIQGYTIGNDMSSRDIEGANPLYLPQAKTYDKCCALGPSILVSKEQPPLSTAIQIAIHRSGQAVFQGATKLSTMKRTLNELVGYLFRESSFPRGCFLLTGTGIVPPDSFTLTAGDRIDIAIDGIGVLSNTVEQAS